MIPATPVFPRVFSPFLDGNNTVFTPETLFGTGITLIDRDLTIGDYPGF